MHTDALAVLDFWFGPPDDPGHAQPRPQWFQKDDAFDAQIRQRLTSMEQSGETARLNEDLKRRTIARVNRPDPVAGLCR